MLEPFSYNPLADPTVEIRLLRVHHGSMVPHAAEEVQGFLPTQRSTETSTNSSSKGSISWTLTHVSIDDCPPYTALSYAWGDPTPLYPIVVNGRVLYLAKNIYEALQAISNHPGSPYLWVDAACIDQSDDAERSSQVLLMHRIYREAEHGLIWLGPPTDGLLNALRVLSQLGWDFWSLRKDDHNSICFEPTTPYFTLAQRFVQSVTDKTWLDIRELLSRPWWRRVWVIQEAILPEEASMMCGTLVVSWRNILEAIQFFSLLLLDTHLDLAAQAQEIAFAVGHFNLVNRYYLEASEESSPGLTLESLLDSIRYIKSGVIKATDNRDHMYGLMGLLKDKDRDAINVDYSKRTTLANINYDMSCILLGRNGPQVMSLCERSPMHQDGLPSWGFDCLDIGGTKGPALLGQIQFRKETNSPYNASSGTSWTPRKLSIPFKQPRLTLRALRQGRVQGLVQTVLPPQFTVDEFRDWLSELETKTRDIASGKVPEVETEYLLSLIWRLPIAGIALRNWKPPTHEEDVQLLRGFKILLGLVPKPENIGNDIERFREWFQEGVDLYMRSIKLLWHKAFVTSCGLPGLGPKDVLEDDVVAIFEGANNPFIIRERPGETFRIVGCCYILGLMRGEAMRPDVTFEDIVLI
ncbi:heterokaryon incompatibility protein [Pochonia chlamydosporia 170]|uniref:Heterokaryon incompatibility protein n=1 Tax=Pochonia chlamydosporia 170 TaxID=1380566 RepID=A0A179F663_METCM|nr:heterokaryon incompatibility protein [Pochonia chlamydosporia 170]OAQ60653.1 heterokaryon incompatibility protein [Pochonia chlamydosporia 170]